MGAWNQIFKTLTIGTHEVRNRIVVPPLVVFGLPDDGSNLVQEAHLRHYKRMANGGAGLLIVESITTDPVHEKRAMIGAYEESYLPGLTELASVCRENDTVALAQITNTGLELMPYRSLAEMPRDAFDRYFDQFITSAGILCRAGFDGVELHGAHGFYLNQVLELNDRTDACGDGNAVLQKMIRTIKEVCGEDFIVDVRIGNHDIDALIRTAKAAEEAGADLLHVSRGAWDDGDASLSKHDEKAQFLHSPAPTETAPASFPYAHTVYMASRVTPEVTIPVIAVGDLRDPAEVEDVLEKGYADLIALGRQHLADPEWTKKVAAGQAPERCLQCAACKWMEDGTGASCAARIIAQRRKA